MTINTNKASFMAAMDKLDDLLIVEIWRPYNNGMTSGLGLDSIHDDIARAKDRIDDLCEECRPVIVGNGDMTKENMRIISDLEGYRDELLKEGSENG